MQYKIKNAYISRLSFLDTVKAKEALRVALTNRIVEDFKLIKLSAPLVTDNDMWLNDDFKITERPIDFDTKYQLYGQILQATTKWRRKMVTDLDMAPNEGVFVDATLPRRDRTISNVSAVVQNELGFDIVREKITKEYPRDVLTKCYEILLDADLDLCKEHKKLSPKHFGNEITYVTYSQLKARYPLLKLQERLDAFAKEYGSFIFYDFISAVLDRKDFAVFSQDTFDFETYCELYVYNESIEQAVCIGYCGGQVNRDRLKAQNAILREDWKTNTGYENMIKQNELLDTVACGLDFSRIVMTVLEKQHIAEVITSVWEPAFVIYCENNGIKIL